MTAASLSIGDAAERAGVSAKTIRYYEEIGLIRPMRAANGYRAFRESDVQKLVFLGRARSLGFTIEDCRALLDLWEDRGRESAEVRRIAVHHLDRIDARLREMREMRATLADLVDACRGDHRPDCPILRSLGKADEPAQG
jgi:Cu(I)-responsive transcriptional regulator